MTGKVFGGRYEIKDRIGIGGPGASALLLGVTGGYPLGADAVARLRRSGAEQHLQ